MNDLSTFLGIFLVCAAFVLGVGTVLMAMLGGIQKLMTRAIILWCVLERWWKDRKPPMREWE
jgi:hypothetical protein